MTALRAVARGHEPEAERVALQPVQPDAQADVLQPRFGGPAHRGDAEARPPVDLLVDRDDVPGLHHLGGDPGQFAALVPVQAGRQAVDPARVGLDEQLGVLPARPSVLRDDREAAQVVVLLGDVQPPLDGGLVAQRTHRQPVLRQHLLQHAQHVAGLELQHLPDVVAVHRLDGAAPAEEVQCERRAPGGPVADPDQGVVDRVVVVHARGEAVRAVRLQVQLGGVQGAGGGVGVLRQQPLGAVELAEPAQHRAEFGQGDGGCGCGCGCGGRGRAARRGGRARRGEQRQQVLPGDRAALEEPVGLAGEGLPPLPAGLPAPRQFDHRPAGQLGRSAQPRVGQLGPDLELARLGPVVAAVVALVHQGGLLGVQLHTGHQVAVARPRVVGDHRGGPAHPGVLLDGERDLVQLDPVAAQLDLVVHPAGALQGAVRVPLGEVAGAVQPLARQVRRGDEALRRQVRPVEVAAGQLDTADVQLTGRADLHRRQLLVQDEAAGAVHRHADRHRTGAVDERLRVDPVGGRVDGALGRAVQIDQLRARQRRRQRPGQPDRERLAAGVQPAQTGAVGQPLGVEQGLEQGRHALEGGHAVREHGVDQGLRVPVDAGRAHHHPRAGGGREDLPLRRVEAHRRLLQHGGVRAQMAGVGQPAQLRHDAVVLDHHALGAAGAAGGVDDVGQRLGGGAGRGVGLVRDVGAPARLRRCVPVREVGGGDDPGAGRDQLGQPGPQVLLGDDHPGPAGLDHPAEPLLRVLGGERQVRGARVQDAPGTGHQRQGRLGAEADAVVGGHAQPVQVRGERVGGVGELAEAQPGARSGARSGARAGLRRSGDRRGVGAGGRLGTEQVGQADGAAGVEKGGEQDGLCGHDGVPLGSGR